MMWLQVSVPQPTDYWLYTWKCFHFPFLFSTVQDFWGVNALVIVNSVLLSNINTSLYLNFLQGNLPKNFQKTWLKFRWFLSFLSQSGDVWEDKNKQKMWRKITKVRAECFPEHGSEDWSMLCFSIGHDKETDRVFLFGKLENFLS